MFIDISHSPIPASSYAALGLLPDLSMRPSGGTAPGTSSSAIPAVASASRNGKPAKGMGRIIRDADGNVVDIIEGGDDEEEVTPWGKTMKGWEDERDEGASSAQAVEAEREESDVVKGESLLVGKSTFIQVHAILITDPQMLPAPSSSR